MISRISNLYVRRACVIIAMVPMAVLITCLGAYSGAAYMLRLYAQVVVSAWRGQP